MDLYCSMSCFSLSLPKIHMVEASKCFSSITEAFMLYSFLTRLCVRATGESPSIWSQICLGLDC